MIGRLLDQRYQVVELLGKGGFGHTYIAQDTRRPGNPTCVVKHLKPATSDPEFLPIARRLFNTEAESLETLGNHDQIPRLLAYFEENEEFYLVQEFIDGQPLSLTMPRGERWSEEQVIKLLQEVLPILEFIHGHGVIHRDIKPDNLIHRASDNKVVLVDFGAVKQVKSFSLVTSEPLKNETIAVGTPGFMPSEQGQGRPRPCSDIYALGMTAIQAITGLSPQQLGEDAVSGEISWQHHAQISNQLASILNKMVRHYFKYRYQSATEALKAVAPLTGSNSPAAVASAMNQVLGNYLADGYVSATKVMQYLQELAKPCYVPSDNETNSRNFTPESVIDATTIAISAQEKGLLTTTPVDPSPFPSDSRLPLNFILKSPQKSRILVGIGVAIAIVTFGIISSHRSQQLALKSANNAVKPVKSKLNQAAEEQQGCLIVASSSNLRSLSGRRRTGKVIKEGTKVTVTGKTEGGWIEISSPESGWIWKGRTRDSCPNK